jgi:hypothetical protein
MNAILLSLLAFVPQNMVPPAPMQNCARENREFAETWAMHDIAVIQAERGDIQGAKHTASQITEENLENKAPSDVTVVSFREGCICSREYPGTERRLASRQYEVFSFDRGPAADSVPSKSPPGLPQNYLAPDPRRGPVVDFFDSRDSQGKRITSRKYADGSIVIETPRENVKP